MDEEKITNGHIVKQIKIGNTEIYVCDDCSAKTQVERKSVLTDLKQCMYKMICNS